MMTMGCAPYVAPEMAGHFRHNAMFIGGNVREAINDGRADYTPIYLSEIEGLFESGEMPIDVALIEVSPPDSHGFCSFGVGVDTTLTAAKVARRRGRPGQRLHAAHLRRQFHSRQRHRRLRRVVAAAVRAEEAGRHRPASRHCPQCGRSDRRRRGAADRHRRNSGRGAAHADGPQGSWRPQRTGFRRRDSADRSRRASPERARTSSRAKSSWASRWGPNTSSSSSTTIRSSNFIPPHTPTIPG